MTPPIEYRLDVWFPRQLPYEAVLVQLLGRPGASGTGFGQRDLSFYYPTQAEAERARDHVHTLKLEALAWSLTEVPGD